jgi:copper homeostasis protein
MKAQLEAACFSVHSALIALKAGADRIEFCRDYSAGGLTPLQEDFAQVKNHAGSVPVFVMIRPRSGNFAYTAEELTVMKASINDFARAGADGFVFGILNPDSTVNIPACIPLTELAGNLPCTFHRAFDRCSDPHRASEDIISCGFSAILTSGRAPVAEKGMELLHEIVTTFGKRIDIIVGGGIRSSNLTKLCKNIPASWFHSAALHNGSEADPEEIKRMKQILMKCGSH